jgi:hypothetical protein
MRSPHIFKEITGNSIRDDELTVDDLKQAKRNVKNTSDRKQEEEKDDYRLSENDASLSKSIRDAKMKVKKDWGKYRRWTKYQEISRNGFINKMRLSKLTLMHDKFNWDIKNKI